VTILVSLLFLITMIRIVYKIINTVLVCMCVSMSLCVYMSMYVLHITGNQRPKFGITQIRITHLHRINNHPNFGLSYSWSLKIYDHLRTQMFNFRSMKHTTNRKLILYPNIIFDYGLQ